MPTVVVIHLGSGADAHTLYLLGRTVEIRRIGVGGDLAEVPRLIAALDGQVDAIGLEGMPATLELGHARRPHQLGAQWAALAQQTPVVEGSGVRAALERWGVMLADRLEPGIFSHKRVLLVPGLNHEGLAQALRRFGGKIRYADPLVYFGLPDLPGVGSGKTLEQAAGPTLEQLAEAPFPRLYPTAGKPRQPRAARPFHQADILAGDIGAIRRYAPTRLAHKIVVVPSASEEDLADLQARGVMIAVMLIPNFGATDGRRGYGVAAAEAVMAALRPATTDALTEDTYLDMLADVSWQPEVRHLQPDEAGINRFAFVIHPLEVGFIHQHPLFRWTRLLPDALVEAVAAYIPPLYISRITGGRSPVTGQRIEGILYSLGATPRQMMRHGERFTYVRLNQAARLAERHGARIMGLGAFTSVVGDAGITVAHEADIAITSGNSLTVAATLEAAKRAVVKMGTADLTQGRAMIIGATGSIGAVCARLLAQAIRDVVLVSIEPEKLIDLKRRILSETPEAQVVIATRADEWLPECDLIVTATSAFGQRIMDITRCKPGAVICDVARPPDINPDEAALRPDVLVIESGEVLIPGDIDFGYDIGLPPKTAYACLAETALLAMEGRFEDYTLGRNISMEQVKEIYRLFKKHQFELAGLRSFGKYVTDEYVAEKCRLADELRADPARLAQVKGEAAVRLAAIPPMSKGVRRGPHDLQKWVAWVGGLGLVAWWLGRRRVGQRRNQG
jgi:predicted amino acid dehydrogenase